MRKTLYAVKNFGRVVFVSDDPIETMEKMTDLIEEYPFGCWFTLHIAR